MTNLRRMPDWRTVYDQADVTRMPWYHPQLDPDVAEMVEALESRHGLRLLDIGTGSGNQAEALRQLGFTVTGTDISQTAIDQARLRYPDVTFLQDDVLSSQLSGSFDIILDRGCFHVFPPEQRAAYVATIKRLLAPEGLFWLKCFSVEEPGDDGPYRYSMDSLIDVFEPNLHLIFSTPTEYFGQLPSNPQALFSVFEPWGLP